MSSRDRFPAVRGHRARCVPPCGDCLGREIGGHAGALAKDRVGSAVTGQTATPCGLGRGLLAEVVDRASHLAVLGDPHLPIGWNDVDLVRLGVPGIEGGLELSPMPGRNVQQHM